LRRRPSGGRGGVSPEQQIPHTLGIARKVEAVFFNESPSSSTLTNSISILETKCFEAATKCRPPVDFILRQKLLQAVLTGYSTNVHQLLTMLALGSVFAQKQKRPPTKSPSKVKLLRESRD
jgi:hypothetical protein